MEVLTSSPKLCTPQCTVIDILLEQATKLNAVMVVEQLSNCATRQRPFPSEEIRGLTHLMGMLKNLPTHSDETLSGRFIEISEQVKKDQLERKH